MRKTIAVLGSALFFAVAPSSVAGLVPWWITRWEFRPPFFDLDATRAVGILLIVAGLPGLVDSFARFALQGLGTPAPIAPTQNLVVTGLYRHVRHPLYVGWLLAIWSAPTMTAAHLVFAIATTAYILLAIRWEERDLIDAHGRAYEEYRNEVPMLIPAVRPCTEAGLSASTVRVR